MVPDTDSKLVHNFHGPKEILGTNLPVMRRSNRSFIGQLHKQLRKHRRRALISTSHFEYG